MSKLSDPRLAEIQFLMALQMRGGLGVVTLADEVRIDNLSRDEVRDVTGGLASHEFRAMLLELVLDDAVGGHWIMSYGGSSSSIDEEEIRVQRRKLTQDLMGSRRVSVRILHKGGLRLWDLRDRLLARRDLEPLGVLLSRSVWDVHLPLRLQWATDEEPVALLLLDLDHFGAVNKQHGHPVGDAVLRATFRLVQEVVGARGEVYRYGGEEIGVILPRTALAEARPVAEEIRAAIERVVAAQTQLPPRTVGDTTLGPLTVTVGGAVLSRPTDPIGATSQADAQLRAAKATGRNRVLIG